MKGLFFLVETHEDDVPFVWFLPSRLGPISVMISGLNSKKTWGGASANIFFRLAMC